MHHQEETCTIEISEEIRKDNAKAFASFFDLHFNAVCYFAERLIKDRLIAEDIVEETFLKLWDKRMEFENTYRMKAFLYITTKNSCINYIRQQKKESQSHAEILYLAEKRESFALNEMIRAEVLNVLSNELNSLPTQCRTILKMYVNGMKNHEIAEKLDLSVNTVRNQKARGLQLLRNSLEGNYMLQGQYLQ